MVMNDVSDFDITMQWAGILSLVRNATRNMISGGSTLFTEALFEVCGYELGVLRVHASVLW